jgi:hypothetical protein
VTGLTSRRRHQERRSSRAWLACQHSLQTTRALGYRMMQFNRVISTNTAAIHHQRLGDGDVLVMVQSLVRPEGR